MADTIKTTAGQTVARELLVVYLNTGTTESPVWSPVGKRVEDSSAEFDWSAENKQDILGNSYGTLKKPIISQSFEPCELDAGDEALQKIWKLAVHDHDAQALMAMDMLLAHFYAGENAGTSTPARDFAEHYDACMVEVTGLGGEGGGSVGMPFTVTFGGNRQTGAVTKTQGVVTFTADA